MIVFEIKNPKLISVNDQYMHPVRKTKKGRYVSYFCKSPALKEFQEFYKEVLSLYIKDDDVCCLKKMIDDESLLTGIFITIDIGIPKKEFFGHDITNYVKALEDSISERLGVDDSRNVQVNSGKSISQGDDWYLRVAISPKPVSCYREGLLESEVVVDEKKNL